MGDDPSLEHEEAPEDSESEKSGSEGEVVATDKWNAAVGKWTEQYLRGSPVAQNTEAWNHLMKVLPHLRDFINQE